MKSQSQVQFLLFFVALVGVVVHGARTGGWAPVDPKDPHVVEIGRFAVDEHNKQAHTDLKFDRVVKSERQVVSGVNYRLTLVATSDGASQNYEAVVWEKAWEKFISLTSFHPVSG